MKVRDSTLMLIFYFLAIMMATLPLAGATPVSDERIDESRVAWTCGAPIASMGGSDVDLERLRLDIAELAATTDDPDERITSRHPQCRALSRTQVVLSAFALAAGIYVTVRWRKRTASERAEKKFVRLHKSLGRSGSQVLR